MSTDTLIAVGQHGRRNVVFSQQIVETSLGKQLNKRNAVLLKGIPYVCLYKQTYIFTSKLNKNRQVAICMIV